MNQATTIKGIDPKIQDESYREIVGILRSQLSTLSRTYGEGFENIMKILKRGKDAAKGDIYGSCDVLSDWMKQKQSEMEEENKLLKESIEELRRSCDELRKKIQIISSMCPL